MLTNKAANQKYHQLFFDAWDTKIQLYLNLNQKTLNSNTDIASEIQQNYQINNQKFIKFYAKFKKNLNKDLDFRYWIDRLEQNKCNIDDYNKKVILPSSLQQLKSHCLEVGKKIFHHASFIHAWLEDFIRRSIWELA